MGKNNFKKKLKQRKLQEELMKSDQNTAATSSTNKGGPLGHSIDKLLDKAEQLIDEFNFELAQKFCQRALETEPDNVRALETSASLLLELGNVDGAKHCLGRAVEVCPDSGFSKYMTLGQLMEGATAVQCYQKGIELMLKEKESREAEEVAAACGPADNAVTVKDISSAYCAIAEIYMTDCCFDENAEEKCKEFMEKALMADPENAEAWQTKANFLISKEEKDEAKKAIQKSVSLWLPKLQSLDKGTLAKEDFDPVEVCSLPFTARVQSGKILIELDEYEAATDVLETLLDEDDEVPDVWYLLGWANYLHGADYHSNARHYLIKAKEVYTKVKYDDADLLSHIEEMLKELGPDEDEDQMDGEENGAKALENYSSGEEDMDQ